LLEGIPDVLANRVVNTVQSILADPAAVIPQLENYFETVEVFFNAISEQAKLVEPVADSGKLMSLWLRIFGVCNLNAKIMPGP